MTKTEFKFVAMTLAEFGTRGTILTNWAEDVATHDRKLALLLSNIEKKLQAIIDDDRELRSYLKSRID